VNDMAIMPQSMPFVTQLAQFLKDNPTMKLEIDGHTDSDGGDVYNLNLSQARADEVKRQLVASGIPAKRLTTKGFGAAKPIKPNTTATGKAENRRVEFIKQE
jgi:outer membrane protein OmpA-like peptidoglycan-associated protein